MKRIIFTSFLLLASFMMVFAEGIAEIKFEKTEYDFGMFSEKHPKVTCIFKFKNVGDGPLIIHQAMASCGCTIPTYPKEPIKPGESGEIQITYDGYGRFPGKFQKRVTIRTNGKREIHRLFIKGEMIPANADVKVEN